LAAKAFLEGEFPNVPWERIDFAGKISQNRNGLDIDLHEIHIVAELKTTEPCVRELERNSVEFGSSQRKSVESDLRKLSDSKYRDCCRYMFVTMPLAYQSLMKFRKKFPEICFVQLGSPPQVSKP
jgi:hypothetical protein